LSFLLLLFFGILITPPQLQLYDKLRLGVNNMHEYVNKQYLDVAQRVKSVTPENEYIIVIQENWEPFITYASQRKTFILNHMNRSIFSCEMVLPYAFTTVTGPRENPDTQKVLACYQRYEEVSPSVFKVFK
ncbi:MAG: hypothetical protein LWX83_16300, partial [Anaerolineae bacterium]|nr:hypothetical protein [Anaerolineae bacterium]